MNPPLDMDKIAEILGAERLGKVAPKGGYFGAVELAAEVATLFPKSQISPTKEDQVPEKPH